MNTTMKYLLLFFLFFFKLSISQELNTETKTAIRQFILAVKTNNKEKIASFISYPLRREYPIPPINNKTEFIARFEEVFDTKLKSKISKSIIDSNWSQVGWRGIMLNNGDLWINDASKISAINYQSKKELTILNQLIALEKSKLHISIKEYLRPKYILRTKQFIIRIDEVSESNYRYTSWSKSKTMGEKPDIIVQNGEIEFDGSGGNHRYIFKNEEYIYECYIIRMGESNDPDARLNIYKNDKEILSQDAMIFPSIPENLFIKSIK
jgi:hypothetical protein